ncbi:MAG: hypothetical protein QOH74_775 [Gaiellales bacterium]|nr:hypothetical protein [Gaiellales bacterium]
MFLTGLPRSGTNMLVRGLGASPEVEVHNEGDRAAFRRYRLRPSPVVRDLVVRSGHRFVLFKPLLDCHRIPELLDDLGTAAPPKAVWAYRDVDGRVHSAISKFGSAATTALSEIASGRGTDWWQAQGLSDESMDMIRAVPWEQASPADGVALLWCVKNRMFFEKGLDRRADVHLVSYNDLVREPAETMKRLCDFLGVAWDSRLCAHIDHRALQGRDVPALDPRLRELCDALTAQLDTAVAEQPR